MKKIKYEKPISLNAGEVASVLGATCSTGNGAQDGCITGNNPDLILYCQSTGNNATGNCETSGNSAGNTCWNTGGTAGWNCGAGGFPG